MNNHHIITLILKHFVYEPTEGQKTFINKLSEFLLPTSDFQLLILKGYAGTGKTTIISSLVKCLPLMGKKAVLLAPTGRAAKVLSNYSEKQASTIHRKIYKIHTSSDGSTSLVLQKNLHKNTIFIIDEASMIPGHNVQTNSDLFSSRNLLNDLMEYIYEYQTSDVRRQTSNKCIFIGDTAQLPPVGLSISPALDLTYLKQSYDLNIDSFELTEVVRQTRKSGILSNATYIRHKITQAQTSNSMLPASNFQLPASNHLPFFSIKGYNDIISITGAELEDALNDAYNKYGIDGSIVICRSNKLANKFNAEIRNRILSRESEIQTGDNMMVVKNNYFWLPSDSEAGFIANGDIIQIQKVKKVYDMYGYRFADATIRLLDYPKEKDIEVKLILNTVMAETPCLPYLEERKLFNEIMKDYVDIPLKRNKFKEVKNNPYLNALQVKFAYSMTCHKTQGGQWDAIFINKGYLTRDMIDIEYLRWLYTALTRAKTKAYLINYTEEFFLL